MGEGKKPEDYLTKLPDIILKVSGIESDKLNSYTKNSLGQNIVKNLGWSIYDLSKLEENQGDGFDEWNCKRIQSCLAKHNTSIIQLILVQQGHMYAELKKKIAKAKLRIKEIDAEIDELNHESFMNTMAIFAEQLYCIAAIAFSFASTPVVAGIFPAVIGFASTGFTLRDFVKTIDQKDQYKQKRNEIALQLQTLTNELEKDLWHDYIYPPEMKEKMLIERSIRKEIIKGDCSENQVQLKVEDQVYQQAEEIKKLREEVTSLQAQIEDIKGDQLNK